MRYREILSEKTAFHGGRKFSKFTDWRISRTNVAGWGIYFSEDEAVASEYVKPNGKMYTVSIPDEDYLDFDKSFAEQSQYIKSGLAKVFEIKKFSRWKNSIQDLNGRDIY